MFSNPPKNWFYQNQAQNKNWFHQNKEGNKGASMGVFIEELIHQEWPQMMKHWQDHIKNIFYMRSSLESKEKKQIGGQILKRKKKLDIN